MIIKFGFGILEERCAEKLAQSFGMRFTKTGFMEKKKIKVPEEFSVHGAFFINRENNPILYSDLTNHYLRNKVKDVAKLIVENNDQYYYMENNVSYELNNVSLAEIAEFCLKYNYKLSIDFTKTAILNMNMGGFVNNRLDNRP